MTKALPRVMLTQRRKAMESALNNRSTRGGGRATPKAWPGQRALGAISFIFVRSFAHRTASHAGFLAAVWLLIGTKATRSIAHKTRTTVRVLTISKISQAKRRALP